MVTKNIHNWNLRQQIEMHVLWFHIALPLDLVNLKIVTLIFFKNDFSALNRRECTFKHSRMCYPNKMMLTSICGNSMKDFLMIYVIWIFLNESFSVYNLILLLSKIPVNITIWKKKKEREKEKTYTSPSHDN